MSLKKHFNRIRYINHMIKNKATGNLDSFAKKNNLSKSALSDIIKDMKELGFPIKYDRAKGSYYYDELGEMPKCLFVKYGELLDKDAIKDVGRLVDLCFSDKAIFIPCKGE